MICGIDEAGRGCIAGDLVVAGVVLKQDIQGLDDSKKLSEKKREILYEKIIKNSLYEIIIFSSLDIDNRGLSACLKEALEKILEKFSIYEIIFDGNTNFGVNNIKTLVKADMKIKEVSAASILAKVTRDKKIKEYGEIYPEYAFSSNKGYGTKAHIRAIKKFGLCPIHRKSFRLKSLEKNLFDFSYK